MSNRFSQSDSSNDDLDRLLGEALECDPPRPLFVRQLAKQLDRAYAESTRGDAAAGGAPRTTSRWWAWGAVAAAMLIAGGWWIASPRYSWASMIAAVEQSEWVSVVANGSNQQPEASSTKVWYSGEHRVMAVQNASHLRMVDRRQGYELSCQAAGETVAADSVQLEKVKTTQRANTEGQFLCVLLNSMEPPATESDQLDKEPAKSRVVESKADGSEAGSPVRLYNADDLAFELIDQSWSRNQDGSVALTVQLDLVEPEMRRIELQLQVDSQTQLPQRGRVAGDAQSLRFTYPTSLPVVIGKLTTASQTLLANKNAQLDRELKQMAGLAGAVVRTGKPETTELNTTMTADATGSGEKQLGEASAKSEAMAPRIASATPPLKPLRDLQAASIPPVKREQLPPARSMEEMIERVDRLLAEHWQAKSLSPVAPASDAEFMRRAYLDLVGRIPTVSEARTFLADERDDRRERLLNHLTGSYDHASHLAAVWRTFLIIETADLAELGGVGEFEAWLTERFRNNQPYDQLVSDLLLAEGRVQSSGPLLFYAAAKLRPEELARQTSRAFLGMRLECAQCHDDFFDDNWKQEDFWAYAAFFARISQPAGRIERVSPVMRVRDITRGETTLPDSEDVVPPRYPLADEPLDAADEVSRRQLLAAWLTAADNPHFARATVNRVWAQLFGRGIVEPVDDMRPANAPVCPEVLDELATYFVRSEFDLRRLISTLVRTRAYQLSSTADDVNSERGIHFAQMNVKCLTAEQLYDCMAVATGVDTAVTDQDGLQRANNLSRQAFIDRFSVPPGSPTQYQAGIAQALTLMNGALTHRGTQQNSGLLGSLKADFFTDEQRVDTLFLATVSRYPTPSEKQAVVDYLSEASDQDERAQILSDALWALLNSAEFTLIH